EVKDPQRLLVQLGWSLRDTHRGPIVLQIERQPKAEGETDANLFANRAAALGEPVAYCIAGGTIVRAELNEGECQRTSDLPGGLAPEMNRRVQAAAITRTGKRAAVVQALDNGRVRLLVSELAGRGGGISATAGEFSGQVGRPVWLAFPGESTERGLI